MTNKGLRSAEKETQRSVLFLQTIGEAMRWVNDSQSICEATQSISFASNVFSLYSVMAPAGDVMQQLPQSANGASLLSPAASDAKGRNQSQQVRDKGRLDKIHSRRQYKNMMRQQNTE